MFFYWQVGVVLSLARRVDLTRARMVGASAGALIAVLSACGCDVRRSVDLAYSLAVSADLWRRPLGLAGVWGGLIRRWLEDLLPPDAHALCRGRVAVIVLRVGWGASTSFPFIARRWAVSDFASRAELIDAVLASAHLPFFLDGRLFARFRGFCCLDGSFFLPAMRTSDYLPGRGEGGAGAAPAGPAGPPRQCFVASHSLDAALRRTDGRGPALASFVSLTTYDGLLRLLSAGHAWAEKEAAAGRPAFAIQNFT